MSEVIIDYCTSETELYDRYAGQHEPQPCFLGLNLRSGRLWAEHDAHVGPGGQNSHGFERYWQIPCLTGTAANKVLEQIEPLAERILADWHSHSDGLLTVAVLGDDAQDAAEQISEVLGEDLDDHDPRYPFSDTDHIRAWSLEEVFTGEETELYGITADTSDERLTEIGQDILAQLRDEYGGVIVVEDLQEHLYTLREQTRDTDQDNDDEDNEDAENDGDEDEGDEGHEHQHHQQHVPQWAAGEVPFYRQSR